MVCAFFTVTGEGPILSGHNPRHNVNGLNRTVKLHLPAQRLACTYGHVYRHCTSCFNYSSFDEWMWSLSSLICALPPPPRECLLHARSGWFLDIAELWTPRIPLPVSTSCDVLCFYSHSFLGVFIYPLWFLLWHIIQQQMCHSQVTACYLQLLKFLCSSLITLCKGKITHGFSFFFLNILRFVLCLSYFVA